MQIPLSSILGSDAQRRKIITLTASSPAVPVPWWAQNGRGLVLVSGCGAGGGGGHYTSTPVGGGAGAYAMRHPMLLNNSTTINVVIGAGGAGTYTIGASGSIGGTTKVAVGGLVLQLGGGGGGSSNVQASGGKFALGDAITIEQATVGDKATALSGLHAGASTLGEGAGCPYNVIHGATGPFGAGGKGSNSLDIQNGIGYGSGGGSASNNSTTYKSGDGAPGLVILEFVEGF